MEKREVNKNTIKKLDYLLKKLMYIKHDAGNCACLTKKHETLNHILGILGYEKITKEMHIRNAHSY